MVDFYEFYEGLQEGWDGPALLVFSDGDKIGARLDRNGLRPARFWRTNDDVIYVASEAGFRLVLFLQYAFLPLVTFKPPHKYKVTFKPPHKYNNMSCFSRISQASRYLG